MLLGNNTVEEKGSWFIAGLHHPKLHSLHKGDQTRRHNAVEEKELWFIAVSYRPAVISNVVGSSECKQTFLR